MGFARLRVANSVIAALALLCLAVHAILGIRELVTGTFLFAIVIASYAGMLLIALHVILAIILTIASSKGGKPLAYPKENVRLWGQRISGILIICFVMFHAGSFGSVENGAYVAHPWTLVTFALTCVFVLALVFHMACSFKPLCMSLGISLNRAAQVLILVIIIAFAICVFTAFGLYLKGWMQ